MNCKMFSVYCVWCSSAKTGTIYHKYYSHRQIRMLPDQAGADVWGKLSGSPLVSSTTLTDPDMRIRCAIGAQNVFAADFHSWRRCAMS
jgi:hypothetical protein